jgi:hypothetical protein
MARVTWTAVAVTCLSATAATTRGQDVPDPNETRAAETRPTLSADAKWVVPLLLGLHGIIFAGAMVIGPIYRANVPQMVEVVRAREPHAHGASAKR